MNITYTNTIAVEDCDKLRNSANWPKMHPDQIKIGLMNSEYIVAAKDGYCIQIDLMAAKGKERFYEEFGFEKRPSNNFGCGFTQRIKK